MSVDDLDVGRVVVVSHAKANALSTGRCCALLIAKGLSSATSTSCFTEAGPGQLCSSNQVDGTMHMMNCMPATLAGLVRMINEIRYSAGHQGVFHIHCRPWLLSWDDSGHAEPLLHVAGILGNWAGINGNVLSTFAREWW